MVLLNLTAPKEALLQYHWRVSTGQTHRNGNLRARVIHELSSKVSTKAALPEAFAHLHKMLQHPKGLPTALAPSIAGFSATGPCPSTDDTSHSHLPVGLLPEKEGLTQH